MEPSAAPTPLGMRVLRVLVGLTVAIFVLTTVGHLLDLLVLDRELRLLDVEDRRSIAAWASTAVLVLAASAAGLLAIVRRPLRPSLIVLAVALAILSAEDGIGIFDQVLRRWLPRWDREPEQWLASIGLLMVLSAFLALRVARGAPRPLGRPVWLGLVALVLAVVGDLSILVIDSPVVEPGAILYETEAALEEGLELLGAGLIAASLVAITIDDVVRGPADRP
jgi:hypothetical protein